MPICTAFFLLTAPAFAQAAGGESETLFQWSGAAHNDSLGHSATDAGDVNADGYPDILVSAPWATVNGTINMGSVFVYSGLDGSLLHQWDGQDPGSDFGFAISSAGDVNADGFDDLIVGARSTGQGSQAYSGSAFVYSGADGSVLYQWAGLTQYDEFGSSVADAGDVNNDGFADVIIGAKRAHLGKGSVDVYSGADGSLLHHWVGNLPGSIGSAVAGAGDVNNDGMDDLAVGSPENNPNGILQAGSVYVYSGANGTLLHQWNSDEVGNLFGSSISKAGDVNADGFADVIIGASGASPSGMNRAGSAFVYSGVDGSLIYRWDGKFEYDTLGQAVSDAGDVNGDGFSDLLVGSPNSNGYFGSVNLYSGIDGLLVHDWQGQSPAEHFGASISGIGDMNRDGLADVVVGAPDADIAGKVDSGQVSVFSFRSFLKANTATISASNGGVISLDLDFPNSAGLLEYKVLISQTGVGPIHLGVDIPLSLDNLVVDTAQGHYPVAVHNTLQGALDANGNASGDLTVPAGISSALIGQVYYVAAIAHQTNRRPEYSSVATSVTITL
ncbi:MAG: FG-GAP repeat protein [Planctomycetes bacterium]|nr:FG-GAP repeat protein [Planctomycetota bacterium]